MQIIKASGEREEFDPGKVVSSLVSAGVPRERALGIAQDVERKLKPGATTKDIYRLAFRMVRKEGAGAAARYNLKKGIMDLGPAGFLFEQYAASLLREAGFEAETNLMMQGECISHEIDIVARQQKHHFLLEAKYRNARGMKIDSEVVMYAHARFLDLAPALEAREGGAASHRMWVITNTKFTSQAVAYASCKGVRLTGWNFPRGEGLERMVERTGLYPITALPSVSGAKRLKEQFASAKIATVREAASLSGKALAKRAGLQTGQAARILREAEDLLKTADTGYIEA